MLGEHEGFTSLKELGEDARETLARAALPAMARIKAGKDVAARRKMIAQSLAQTADDDPYWIEAFASHLTGDGKLQAAEAEAVAFVGAWALIDKQMSDQIRAVNNQGRDPFAGQVLNAMTSAAPEFGKRMLASKIDSDEVMFRVALAHLFRRDPDSAFQMFVIDAVARLVPKAMKMSLGDVVRSAIQRYEDSAAPVDAWGYVVVLRDLTGKQGYYLQAPDAKMRKAVDDMIVRLREVLPLAGPDEINNHLLAAACSGYLFQGALGQFASTMSVIFERMEMQYGIVYASEKDENGGQGTTTQVFDIPANSVEEARRASAALPQVKMHDDFRQMSEYLNQMQDEKAQRDASH
jgi:hypothetical protein